MRKILLVEDSDQDAFHVTRLLKTPPAFYETTRASSLSGALFCLEQSRDYAAVLLDLNLTDCQGVETLNRINESAPDLPIIVLTGLEDTELAQRAVKKGAQDFLVKSAVTGGVLDRAIRLSYERKRKDQVRREFNYATITHLSGDNDPAVITALRGHLKKVIAHLEDLRTYIRENAPSHVDALTKLEEKHDIELVLRDVGSMLRLTTRPRKISEKAMEVVSVGTSGLRSAPTEDEARQFIFERLTESTDDAE